MLKETLEYIDWLRNHYNTFNLEIIGSVYTKEEKRKNLDELEGRVKSLVEETKHLVPEEIEKLKSIKIDWDFMRNLKVKKQIGNLKSLLSRLEDKNKPHLKYQLYSQTDYNLLLLYEEQKAANDEEWLSIHGSSYKGLGTITFNLLREYLKKSGYI